MYPNTEKFLEKYEGRIGLAIVKKLGLFSILIAYQDDPNSPALRQVGEILQPTLEEAMRQLEIQIGRGDLF